jgi:hypothetical protein
MTASITSPPIESTVVVPRVATTAFLATAFDRVFWTYIQAFLGFLVASDTLDVSALQAAGLAAIPAVLNLLIAFAPAVPGSLPFAADVVARVARTFALSFAGLVVAGWTGVTDFRDLGDLVEAAAVASIPAALALAKALIAQRFVGGTTPALLPARLDVSPSAHTVLLAR